MRRTALSTTAPPALAIFVLVAACAGASPTPSTDATDGAGGGEPTAAASAAEPTDGPPTGTDGGSCHVDVTGDVETSWDGSGGPSAVGTDYWYTRDELEQAADMFDTPIVEGEPVFYVLIINCTSPSSDPSISLLPGNETTFDDMPYGPGTYTIPEGGALGGGAEPGEIGVLFTIGTDQVFEVSDAGELQITKWDASGITGTFEFGATESFATDDAAVIQVAGSFDFGCTDPSICTP